MPANIESFVKTLESEGVEAGKKAADLTGYINIQDG